MTHQQGPAGWQATAATGPVGAGQFPEVIIPPATEPPATEPVTTEPATTPPKRTARLTDDAPSAGSLATHCQHQPYRIRRYGRLSRLADSHSIRAYLAVLYRL